MIRTVLSLLHTRKKNEQMSQGVEPCDLITMEQTHS